MRSSAEQDRAFPLNRQTAETISGLDACCREVGAKPGIACYYRTNFHLFLVTLLLALGQWAGGQAQIGSIEKAVLVSASIIFALCFLSDGGRRKSFCAILLPPVVLILGISLIRIKEPEPKSVAWLERQCELMSTQFCGKRSSARRSIKLPISGTVMAIQSRSPAHALRFVLVSTFDGVKQKFMLTAPDVPWEQGSQIKAGAAVFAFCRLNLLASPGGLPPSPFSYEGYLFRRGYTAVGQVLSIDQLDAPEPKPDWKERLVTRMVGVYGLPDAAIVLLAMTLGLKDLPGPDLLLLFRETGTMHLLVVSGFQVGVIFFLAFRTFCYLFCRLPVLPLFVPAQIPAALFAFSTAALYAFLCGAELPVIRALLLVSIVAGSELAGRRARSFRNLLVALLAMLLFWPGSLFEPSFQLTFLAILGLFVAGRISSLRFCPVTQERLEAELLPKKQDYFNRSVLPSLLTCLFAWLFTLPVQLFWFRSVAPLAPVFNFFVAAAFTLCFTSVGGILLLFFSMGVPGSDLLLKLNLFGGEVLLKILWFLRNLTARTWAGYRTLDPVQLPPLIFAASMFDLLLLGLVFVWDWKSSVKMSGSRSVSGPNCEVWVGSDLGPDRRM